MKIQVTNNKVTITWLGYTKETTFDELVRKFKDADERERKRLAINLFDSSVFKTIHKAQPIRKKPSTTQILHGCNQVMNRTDDDYWEGLEEVIDPNPYFPLY